MKIKLTFVLFCLVYLCSSIVDRTYYIYLGLDIQATQSQIQSAYQEKKAKIESLQDPAARETKTKLLEEAYAVLKNDEKRSLYEKFNKDLIKKDFVLSNAKKITTKDHRKDKTMKLTIPVSVEDVYHGKTVQAKYLKKVACDVCRGTGAKTAKDLKICPQCGGKGFSLMDTMNHYGQRFVGEKTCGMCQGWGKSAVKQCGECHGKKILEKIQTVKIQIPNGLPDGNLLKIRNFGDEPVTGAPSDLEVTIVQIPTLKWSRNKNDLIYTMEISLKEAIFGFNKTFTHLNGNQYPVVRQEVTHKDSTITLKEQGIKNPKTGKMGQLIIKFKIVMPNFTDRQLDMWEDFFLNNNL